MAVDGSNLVPTLLADNRLRQDGGRRADANKASSREDIFVDRAEPQITPHHSESEKFQCPNRYRVTQRLKCGVQVTNRRLAAGVSRALSYPGFSA